MSLGVISGGVGVIRVAVISGRVVVISVRYYLLRILPTGVVLRVGVVSIKGGCH